MSQHCVDCSQTMKVLKDSSKQPTKVMQIEYWRKSNSSPKMKGILKIISKNEPGRRMFYGELENWDNIKDNKVPYCQPYIDHSNWVIENNWQIDNNGKILFKFIEGGNLDEWLRIHSNDITKAHIMTVFRQLMTYVYCIHKINITHRDIAPTNIMMPNNDKNVLLSPNNITISIIDISSASLDNGGNTTSSCFTQTAFKAPEIIKNSEWSEKMDIFSCGRICEHMLEQCNIFDKQLQSTITRMTLMNPKLRPSAQAVLNDEIFQIKINKNIKRNISGKKRKRFVNNNTCTMDEIKTESEPTPKRLKTNDNGIIHIACKITQSAPPTVELQTPSAKLLESLELKESNLKYKMDGFEQVLNFYIKRVNNKEKSVQDGTMQTIGFVYFYFDGSAERAMEFLTSIMPTGYHRIVTVNRKRKSFKFLWYGEHKITDKIKHPTNLKHVLQRVPDNIFKFKC
eukprot:179661_1